jgi:serine/threonine-protein kinase
LTGQLPFPTSSVAPRVVQRKQVRGAQRVLDLGGLAAELLGDALIHEALGRGHLALHEWREAADDLAATAAAPQTPELHSARGRALGELYRRAFEDALDDARRSGDQARLVRRQQELAAQLLAPARAELEQSRTSGQDTALLDAQLALYRGEFGAAEVQARQIARSEPSLAEAHTLAADAAYRAAAEASSHGDYDAARKALDRSIAAYGEASVIARSDPSVYRSAAVAWQQRAELDSAQDQSNTDAFVRALDLIDQGALRADSDNAPAHATRSNILVSWYRNGHAAPDDARSLLDRAISAAARAVELDRGDALCWVSLGVAHTNRGGFAAYHGESPAPWFRIAGTEFDAALAIQPGNMRAINGVGSVHRWLGSDLDKTGQDPTLEYTAARSAYQRAIEIDPQYVAACSNRTEIEVLIAEHDAAVNQDPSASVEASEAIGARCLTVDPRYYLVLDYLARGALALGQYLVQNRRDPASALRRAKVHLDADAKLHSQHTELWSQRGVAARIEATALLQQDTDPRPAITDGRKALASALKLMPESAYSLLETARLDLIDAVWATKSGQPAAWLGAATGHAQRAADLDKQVIEVNAILAYLRVVAPPPSYDVACAGLPHADQAVKLDPRLPELTALHAALRWRCDR